MGSDQKDTSKMVHLSVTILSALICSAYGAPQGFNGDPSMAKIIQEQRFNAGDGRFGNAVQQEDNIIIKEQSSGNNERIGEYSYIGDDGKTYTVRYEAGVNGFRILNGDHIPSGGQTSAQISTDPKEIEEYDYEYYDETKQASPFVNPHDPTHQSPELLAGNLAGHLAGVISKMEARNPPTTPRPGLPTTSPPLRIFPISSTEVIAFHMPTLPTVFDSSYMLQFFFS